MIGKLLCKCGIHRYRDLWRGPHNGMEQSVLWKCTRCDKEERVTLISPISGPRTGPMHPKAEERTKGLVL